jgi:glycosyltransferase involved in cell wall biosynthesis
MRRDWEVHLIVASGGDSAFSVPGQVRHHRLASFHKRRGFIRLWDNWAQARELGRVVRKENLNAVLAVSTVANVQLALADLPANVIRVGSEHCYPAHFPLPFYKEWFRRYAYARLNAVVCPTQEAADYITKICPGVQAKSIPNWLTWPLPRGDGISCRVSRQSGRKLFIACGRFDKLKGFEQLISMFAVLKDRLPEWDLVILGDGEGRLAMESQINRADLGDRVFLPGWTGDIGEVFVSGDIFLFPSVSEGFALVLVEAMACGLPCVSYDCKVGPAEIIRDGIDGVLVPVGDEEAFTAAMVRLARDDDARRRLALACPEVLSRFSEATIQPLWCEILGAK